MINFDNQYTKLPDTFYQLVTPTPIVHPKMHLWNDDLAHKLGINITDEAKADYFSGNKTFEKSSPLAMAYAGHQFGHFTMLGDGRAILLGDVTTDEGKTVDIQLKGSGITPFSRRGDGRGTLSSMLREYLISEAMHALHIPTSRSLAVVGSNEKIIRQFVDEKAVLTRTASSFIRVGTFEYAANFQDKESLQSLFDFTLQRHYPQLLSEENPAMSFLQTVIKQQVKLVVHWMRVGFIHGVMNTDNITVSGETIDYGPCAFMNVYHPQTVFSSIDENGRYSFGNQASINLWNMSCLAGTLLPLIDANEKIAIDSAEQMLNTYPALFKQEYNEMMANKIGFTQAHEEVNQLVHNLLELMQSNQLDYTNTFLYLSDDYTEDKAKYQVLDLWKTTWTKALANENISMEAAKKSMRKVNPFVIPRNNLVENALREVREKNDFSAYKQLQQILSTPYDRKSIDNKYLQSEDDFGYQTFCGT